MLNIEFKPGYTPALDGVRGVAILLVLIFHQLRTDVYPFNYLAGLGWIGVDLFFVLSGFLITGLLLDAKDSDQYIKKFYIRRVLRIFPLYYMVLGGFFLYATFYQADQYGYLIEHQIYFWTYTQNLLFSFNNYPPDSPILNHFWSLAIEEQFYLVWPALVHLLSRRKLLLLCLVLVAVSIGVRWQFYDVPFSYVFTLCRMDTLIIGAAAAIMIRSHPDVLNRCVLPLGALGVTAVGLAITYSGTTNPVYLPNVVVTYTAIAIVFAVLIVMVFETGRAGNAIRAMFDRAPLKFLGKYSYGIYVYHWIVVLLLRDHYQQIPFIVPTVITIVVSMISYHLVEERFLKLKDRWA